MSLLSKTVFLPVFIETGRNLLTDLDSIIHRANLHFTKILLLTGPSVTGDLARNAATSLRAYGYDVRVRVVKNNTHSEAKKVIEAMDKDLPDLVIAIGGGRVIDVGKFATYERMVNFVVAPTSASNDGIASPIAVIQFKGRVKSILCRMPMGVIADLDIISKAPQEYLRAGVGDVLGNLSSCRDYELSHIKRGTRMDNFARIISVQAANTVLHASPADLASLPFISTLIEGLIMSGIAMGIAGNSLPASGAEHMISHSLDRGNRSSSIHGLQVALALPFTMALRGEDHWSLLPFYKSMGLPIHPRDLGFSREEFLKAVTTAITTRPGRYTILNEIANPVIFERAYDRVYGQ